MSCLISESVAHGKPLALSCLNNPSIIMSRLSIYHQPSFLVVTPIISTNRDEVEHQLPSHYQNSPRGNNRRLINLSLKFRYKFIYYRKKSINATKSIRIYTWLWNLLRQSGDIESNPGPNTNAGVGSMTLTTLNVRGLKKETKFKQLLNRLHKQSHLNSSVIITLQETHLEYNNLKYTWSGNHVFTPSNGAKGGLITLLSGNITVLDSTNIENDAQISTLRLVEQNFAQIIILVNLHSPCAHNDMKINFFKLIGEQVEEYMIQHSDAKIILMGDYNTTFNTNDRQNTTRSASEIKIADFLTDYFQRLELRDCWPSNDTSMTWRHGIKMSKIDRIVISNSLSLSTKIKTDWSMTESDHCAVIVSLNNAPKKFDKIVRIDTRFMSNIIKRQSFLKELDERMSQLMDCNMNPHQKLEFLKMSIRSIAIDIASNHKKLKEKEFNEIRDEINFWHKTLESSKIDSISEMAKSKLDTATINRDKFLEERGVYLSDWAKTRWYQEGEKGTKYFLNMLRSRSNKLEMSQLIKADGTIVKDNHEISLEVENFYKNLYEKGNSREMSGTEELNDFLKHIESIPPEYSESILAPLSINDLYETLRTCVDSAPGPDGIPYSIIKLTWKHFGPLLTESWMYSLATGSLTHSHNDSYLRLLPKEGKDQNFLKNWRPITLSNCDIKLVTKTFSSRMSKNLDCAIGPQQTAYLKTRQITDNLNIMQHVLEKSKELDVSSMIMSLDAEKAFDSIEHWYIKAVLRKLGLSDFVKVFDLLYSNQRVNILLNNQNAGSYNIKNGVKQGDALSCILFILGIEPLIKNIEYDVSIPNLNLGEAKIPKVLSYADDVACLIKPSQLNLDAIFKHYERLTNVSGLKLNAEKTEIIEIQGSRTYDIKYLGHSSQVTALETIKINGLYLSYNIPQATKSNMDKLLTSLETQLKQWSKRYLSIIGKIQIFKTFGLSHILYIASTVLIPKQTDKKITDLIYRFIWNHDLTSKKAPDRIKRTILSKKIKELGFGMLDYKEVIRSIRLKTFLRLSTNRSHPMHDILSKNISSSTVNIKSINKISPCIDDTIKELNKAWKNLVTNPPDPEIGLLKSLVLNEYVGNLLTPKFNSSRLGRLYRHDKLCEIANLDPNHPILKKLEKKFANFLSKTWDISTSSSITNPNIYCPTKTKILYGSKITSKNIRSLDVLPQNLAPKMLMNTTTDGLIKLGNLIAKMSNVKLQTIAFEGSRKRQ